VRTRISHISFWTDQNHSLTIYLLRLQLRSSIGNFLSSVAVKFVALRPLRSGTGITTSPISLSPPKMLSRTSAGVARAARASFGILASHSRAASSTASFKTTSEGMPLIAPSWTSSGPSVDPVSKYRAAAAEYEKDGYTIIRNAIDKDLVGEMSEHLDFIAVSRWTGGIGCVCLGV
jgi:hypothetical protein